MEIEQAINLLKNVVKYSHLDNQKHLDLAVAVAHERPEYEKALMIVTAAVARGEMTDSELKTKLGLI